VKTSTISQLLDALDAKLATNHITTDHGGRPDVPWTRDHQFIAEVLRDDSLEHLTYTSWFVHEQASIDGQSFDLLDPFRATLSYGDPAAYRRAFFYVRLPKTGDILRVETSRLMIEDEETRDQIQYKALKETAQTQDVPRAIKRADRIARISQENRNLHTRCCVMVRTGRLTRFRIVLRLLRRSRTGGSRSWCCIMCRMCCGPGS